METIGIEDQINSDGFFKFCDYFYSPNNYYPYALEVLKKYPNMKMFSPENPMDKKTAIIFVGMCCQVEECFKIMPDDGNYIVIQRDNERPFIESYYAVKRPSVKRVYTIECQVNYPDVIALPHGVASIEGPNYSLESVRELNIGESELPSIFCRLNTNPITHARTAAINSLRGNPLVTMYEHQLSPVDFFMHVKAHKFAMALQSGGKDTTRIWEALCLGTIPIISDCMELRYFEDMPVAYYPSSGITKEWIDSFDENWRKTKSLNRATMSYWRNDIMNLKLEML